MNFLRRLLGGAPRSGLRVLQPPPKLPYEYEIRPGLKVQLDRRDQDWHYMTEGLSVFGQTELRMAIRWPDGVPNDPFVFFNSVFDQSSSGAVVDANGRTLFGGCQFFGRTDITGMMYVPEPSLLWSNRDSLLVLPMIGAESQLREMGGSLRLLALWGRQARYFPFPEWFDPKRRPLAWAEDVNRSTALGQLEGMPCHQVRVIQYDSSCVHLRIERNDHAVVRDVLLKFPEKLISFRTGFDSAADSLLTWLPRDPEPNAIGLHGSPTKRICGCYFLCVQHGEADFGRLLEDGFSFTLTATSFRLLFDGICEGHDVQIESESLGLKLEWL